jgi:hypothetical protein
MDLLIVFIIGMCIGWLFSQNTHKGDAVVRDLEERLIAVRGSISLAIVKLLPAHRAEEPLDTLRNIDDAGEILERARVRSEL